MGAKGEKKKELILNTARDLFIKYGFRNVTMKDIVEKCEISRGGLYLYFQSTSEIFEEILKDEPYFTCRNLRKIAKKDSSISEILGSYLEEQKREILTLYDLKYAKYEYYMSGASKGSENILRIRFDEEADALSDLIKEGIDRGEFVNDDSMIAAKNILYVCEGLKIASLTSVVSEETVNEQLSYMWGGLLPYK